MIRGRFLVKARKLGMLVMTFIALAAILRASGVDDPCCDRTAAIIMQCSLVRRTCPDDGMVTLDAANAQRLTDAYICGVCAGYDKNDPLSDCICSPRAADMLWRNFYANDRRQTPNTAQKRHRQAHNQPAERHRGALSQDDVAKAFGITRHSVMRWEKTQTCDGPGNRSNPWGYYRSLRCNPALRGAYDELARQAGMYNNARSEAKQKGIRFRMTFTQFNERLLAHGNGRM